MKIAIPKERRAHEARVAASPETTKKLVGLGCEVVVETGAGLRAAFTDQAYQEAGATLAPDGKTAMAAADVVLKVQRPEAEELGLIKSDAILVAILDPFRAGEDVAALAKAVFPSGARVAPASW